MNTLQLRGEITNGQWKDEGHRSESKSDLIRLTTLSNVQYRIVDANGKVVWKEGK
jgi:hypothetical protein